MSPSQVLRDLEPARCGTPGRAPSPPTSCAPTSGAPGSTLGLDAEIYSLHLEAPLDVQEPERSDVMRTALELNATVYDAVFITLSRSLGVPLLTAERKTTPWVVKLGRLVVTVRG